MRSLLACGSIDDCRYCSYDPLESFVAEPWMGMHWWAPVVKLGPIHRRGGEDSGEYSWISGRKGKDDKNELRGVGRPDAREMKKNGEQPGMPDI